MSVAVDDSTRSGKALLNATDVFAQEHRLTVWWHLASGTVLLTGTLLTAALAPWWPLRAACSILSALLMVRLFIIFHDFQHGSVLRGSRLADVVFSIMGMLLLTPPRSWRESHNFHHGHVGKISGSGTGSFPVMTTDTWLKAPASQRFMYRFSRHPMTIACAYLTVFLFSITLGAFLRDPRKHWDSGLALLLHFALIAGLWIFAGPSVMLFAFLLPLVCSSALGAYLFYAQHNFVGMQLFSDEWNYYQASVASSSYMKLGPIMRRFTGNIGYHHVHHLNPLIPFYRLPEAMAAIPELQQPVTTTLHPKNILASMRLKLWDPARQKMVGFREADAAQRAPASPVPG